MKRPKIAKKDSGDKFRIVFKEKEKMNKVRKKILKQSRGRVIFINLKEKQFPFHMKIEGDNTSH